jgi:uncharacterized membrane protein YdjX (TVP38/TMEM64 family)
MTLFDLVGRPLLDHLDANAVFDEVRSAFERGGFWIVLWVGITPIPFHAAALAAGLTHCDPALFLVATMLPPEFALSRARRVGDSLRR